jgi:hypothetical protein
MRKCKEGDERKQTLDAKIYLVVSVGTKPPLVHVVEALTVRDRSSGYRKEATHEKKEV